MTSFNDNNKWGGRASRDGNRHRGGFHTPRSFQSQQQRGRAKVKTPPPPPKPCTVYLGTVCLYYDKPKRMLTQVQGIYTRFPSRKKARKAIWNTCQQRAEQEGLGGKELALQYAIVDA